MISVIIPVYNLSQFLTPCVKSVCCQSRPDLEILLIDDGSTDESAKICEELCSFDGRVRLIRQNNSGVSAARNTGLDNAKGEYIAFVDGDDIIAPDYLERLMPGLEDGCVLSMCGHARIRSQAQALPPERTEAKRYPAEACAERLIRGAFPVGICGGVLPRARIGALRFPDGVRNNEDKLFLYQYLLQNEQGSVCFTNDRLYGYLVRDGSATRGQWSGSSDVIRIADEMYELTLRTHPEWEAPASNQRMAARFDTMKAILRSERGAGRERGALKALRSEILSFGFPKSGSRRLKTAYRALRLGLPFYRGLVRSYYLVNGDARRFRANERRVRQD